MLLEVMNKTILLVQEMAKVCNCGADGGSAWDC